MLKACYCLLAFVVLSFPAVSLASTSPHHHKVSADSGSQQAMNKLVKAALEQSLRTIYKQKKPIYPFALLEYSDGKVRSITYKAQKNKDGSLKPQPSAEKWAAVLFVRMREMAKRTPGLTMAALTRMDTITDKQGKKVMGIWCEVDRRGARPWVVFMPLLKQKDGSYKQGKLIYYATNQAIFKHAATASAKPSKSSH